MNPKRVRQLNDITEQQSAVLCLLNRDRRSEDNWAFVFAYRTALKYSMPLFVASCIDFKLKHVNYRNMSFLLDGLEFLEKDLNALNIHFILFSQDIEANITNFIEEKNIGIIVSDFSPLAEYQKLNQKIANSIPATFYEVDTHNIVPAFYVSDKQEYGAYTIRPKIKKCMKHFMNTFPRINPYPHNENVEYMSFAVKAKVNLGEIKYVNPTYFKAGNYEEELFLAKFINDKLNDYADKRNHLDDNHQSDLSPYINFGFISTQRIAMVLMANDEYNFNQDVFLEELIVRKELSDNFCLYNPDYDNLKCAPKWAKITINNHRNDVRPYIYSLEEFENAATHDKYWNAAQKQMLSTGKMHGYMRMYWGKKILEWSETPEEAMETAIYLNDTYSIDGFSPNGYAGIAWAIAGVHDRGWKERDIFGKLRYMNDNGLKSKHGIKKYVKRWL